MARMRDERGFTLPELMVVTLIVLTVLAAALWLLRPADYTDVERTASRRTDLALILQAFERYKQQHGALPADVPAETTPIGSSGEGDYNACPYLVPDFLDDMPLDPTEGLRINIETDEETNRSCAEADVEYLTGYTIRKNTNGSLTVGLEYGQAGSLSLTGKP